MEATRSLCDDDIGIRGISSVRFERRKCVMRKKFEGCKARGHSRDRRLLGNGDMRGEKGGGDFGSRGFVANGGPMELRILR